MTDALIATISMILSCVVGVVGTQAETANHGWLAAVAAGVGFLTGIAYTVISVNVLDSHNLTEKVVVIGLITVAVLVGTKAGQMLGQRILRQRIPARPRTTSQRLDAIEAALPGFPLPPETR